MQHIPCSSPFATASTSTRVTSVYPEEAVLRCRAGIAALKGNVPEKAAQSFRQALDLNPMLWEAFEGLCAVGGCSFLSRQIQQANILPGQCPEIDDLFPARPTPVKQSAPEESFGSPRGVTQGPMATGLGFFTPDAPNAYRSWNLDQNSSQVFRMGPSIRPRDSL